MFAKKDWIFHSNAVLFLFRLTCFTSTENRKRFESLVFFRYLFDINEDPIYISAEETDYPLAYSILVHYKAHQLLHLLSAIYAPQNVYCIHVDRKSSKTFRKVLMEITGCFSNIFLANKSEDVIYASFSRLRADINCMDDLLNSSVGWKYLINLCGQVSQ